IDGVFNSMEAAIEAAYIGQQELIQLSIEKRKTFISAMRETIIKNADEIAKMAVLETKLGKIADKVNKNILAAKKTPGVEDIEPKAFTGDNGFTLVERAPYGVIGAITPSTNPSETVICNSIGMIAAGNSVVFNCHPGAKNVTKYTIQLLNRAITQAGGPANLLNAVDEPTIETGKILMQHPKIRVLVVTGGPEIVRIAMNSGKKVIGAGPGNPPVVVDETADIKQAAKDIVEGAAFDNNVLCIAEKEVFVVDKVADKLIESMQKNGAYLLSSSQLDKLMPFISAKNSKSELMPNKDFVGRDIGVILSSIGIKVPESIVLAIAEVPKQHPLVAMEQLMPVLPIVRVKDVDEGIQEAYKAENGCFHTAMMHSTNVQNLSKMAKKMNTSIFVKNAPSYAGLGMLGEGYTTFTIASPTGEGLTSPFSFTRQRRCVLKDQFRIV
ncbi:MAG: aldehyde dehydrogenase family protein, partial [Ruminiclostridium sp.]